MESTIIMMSAYGTIDTAIEAMKLGAYDYISKPFKTDEIILTLRKAEEREQLRKENQLLRREVQREYSFENIVSKNPKMKEIFEVIKKVAPYKSTISSWAKVEQGRSWLQGHSIITAIESKKPFIAVNCGAIPEESP